MRGTWTAFKFNGGGGLTKKREAVFLRVRGKGVEG